MVDMPIYCHLERLLKERGMAYQELSRRAGISYVALWKLAQGKRYNPSLEVIEALCKVLRCEVGELFSLKKKK